MVLSVSRLIDLVRIGSLGVVRIMGPSLPFPCFVNDTPVDVTNNRAALAAVGRCRLDPATCFDTTDYRAICAKNREQALVDDTNNSSDTATKEENKKLKKKYMKQGIAMASTYLQETLQLDVSIVDVQIVVSAEDILATDGCLAACLLDAGCAAIVMDGTNMEAMDVAKIPRERLIAHFGDEEMATKNDAIASALQLAGTISVGLSSLTRVVETVDNILKLVPDKQDKVSFLMPSNEDGEEFYRLVSEVSKKCQDGKGTIGLVDPTATDLGLSFAACMKTDRPDGLFTTVVCTRSDEALGLVYSSKESIITALECGRGVYYSRSRNALWRKGDTSGHFQSLHRLDVDCDGDALRFIVTQRGDDTAAFCHLNTLTCWGEPRGLRHLEATLQDRLKSAPVGSYTKRLFEDPELLRDKLVEEAQELSEATDPQEVAGELADVLYFAMVRAAKAGVSIDDAVAELDRRTRKVTRRQGDSKAFRISAGDAILGKSNPNSNP